MSSTISAASVINILETIVFIAAAKIQNISGKCHCIVTKVGPCPCNPVAERRRKIKNLLKRDKNLPKEVKNHIFLHSAPTGMEHRVM